MLTFLIHCHDCRSLVAAVDVAGDDWHESECWAFLAACEHREVCTGSPELSTPTAELSTVEAERARA